MAKHRRTEDTVKHAPKRRRMESSVDEHEGVVVQLQELPRDVLFQFLSRLPVKPLMRCKVVCKSWSSLIRDPLFARAHQTLHDKNQHATNLLLATWNIRTKQPNNLHAIQLKHDESGKITSTPPIHLATTSHTMWSPFKMSNIALSAGLVCHYSLSDDEPVHIFSPCTREVLRIPMQRFSKHISLGFSSLTNEYKLFRGIRSQNGLCKLEILTLGGGGTWRDLPEMDYKELGLLRGYLDFARCYVCIHGALHWIQRAATNNRYTILAFDVGQETFRVIPLPQEILGDWRLHFIQVNGCLAVFKLLELQARDSAMDFWILKDYQNRVWFKDSIIFPDRWYKLGSPHPVGSIHTGSDQLLLTPTRDPGNRHGFVHLYDMKLKTYNKTEIVLPEGSVIAAAGYDETIFSLKQ